MQDIEDFLRYLIEWRDLSVRRVAEEKVIRIPRKRKLTTSAKATVDVGVKETWESDISKPPNKKQKLEKTEGQNTAVCTKEKKQPSKKKATNVGAARKKKTESQVSSTKQIPGFLTNNTFVGFLVTLRATLEILSYLTQERNFLYLMTARLNQDNLEVSYFLPIFHTRCTSYKFFFLSRNFLG